jgi:hypothetical protein
MRVLLYGMQSSGASAIAYTMAQRPGCVALVDIWNMFVAPELDTAADVVAKVVVTTAYPLHVHKARFKPDVTVLVLRHPIDNFHSLATKKYANENGLIGEKFRFLDGMLGENSLYDYILYYEDFVASPALLIEFCNKIGWTLGYDSLVYPRDADAIRAFNQAECPGHQVRLKYGLGQYRPTVKRQNLVSCSAPAGKNAHLAKLFPNLLARYEEIGAARGAAWKLPETALLSCKLDHFIDLALGFAKNGRSGAMLAPSQSGDGAYHIADSGQVGIAPNPGGGPNGVTIGGLPGAPFNRLTGIVYLKNPYAAETQAMIRVEESGGNVLARQEIWLSHAELARFSLAYQAGSALVALYLGAMRRDGSGPADDTLYFEDICLDYVQA